MTIFNLFFLFVEPFNPKTVPTEYIIVNAVVIILAAIFFTIRQRNKENQDSQD